jgi:UDP-2,3-diacylglucosamine hydrolase
MATLFISDLHLEDSRPEIAAILIDFLRGKARAAEALYILGDLFEFWIGDDFLSATAEKVAGEIDALSRSGVPVWFQHGNRDFLLGQTYAEQCGMQLMSELEIVNLYGRPTLLLHGDTLCTDDIQYQAFRRQVRNPAFQAMFLAQSPDQRLAMAVQARDASKQHTGKTAMAIMDVNEAAVLAAFEQAHAQSPEQKSPSHMIHGHTHRPAVHQHVLANGLSAERIVLADWYQSGSYLQVSSAGAVSIPLSP